MTAAYVKDEDWQRLARMLDSERGACINCDAPVPKELMTGLRRLDEDQLPHRATGWLDWDVPKLEKFRAGGEYVNNVMTGSSVREAILKSGKRVFGTAALDQLQTLGLIRPVDLAGQCLYAWGDIFRTQAGDKCVRYLYVRDGGLHWGLSLFATTWGYSDPAAVLKTNG